ncbi:transmembrane protein 50B [Tribolium castaneum]|uniref:Transmembrane protein 50B-like Protein n=1 Tax=Tribolium castaneum TaxID=7070 RepID=D6WTE5_TRICA|nr:PREDICTED: transmembrane protein 50B [Tribolium castaneum]EFA06708.1 Transmembrane protein 50B-like Protein [Tribolium castaneum]|eukprot:XP_973539.1 PREDICTED: transmembrane protein 50B [Tribolium castaneum]
MYQTLVVPCLGEVSPLKFNALLSCLAGLAFFSAWWLLIGLLSDNLLCYQEFFPALFSSMALVLINIIPTSLILEPQLHYTTKCGILMSRTCLFIGFMIAFGALIGASYILINNYLLDKAELNKWPGWSVFLQNLLIFSATLLLRSRKSLEYF